MGGLIKIAIERPVAVLALILLTVLFGIVALRNIPIQMSPDIEKPILEVRVAWPGASPEDVDREVVARLESELSGLNGVDELVSSSRRGRASVTLTYTVNQDMDKALVLLLSKLSSVTGLPSDARTPEVRTSNSDDSPIARLALVGKPGKKVDLEGLGNFLETQIVEPLGRVNGVSEITFNGGGNKEMRIFIDPAKLTFYRITLTEVIDALRTSSSMMSVGSVTEGKRTYAVRAEAVNYTPDAAGKIVLRTDVSATGTLVPLLLSDIATISLQSTQRSSYRRLNGEEAVIINALRAPGVNVVETMERLRDEIEAPEILQLQVQQFLADAELVATAVQHMGVVQFRGKRASPLDICDVLRFRNRRRVSGQHVGFEGGNELVAKATTCRFRRPRWRTHGVLMKRTTTKCRRRTR